MHPDTISFLEVVLRFLSAFSMTFAAVYLFHSLRQGRIHPAIAWKYTQLVLTVSSVWRWVVVILIRSDLLPDDLFSAVDPWVLPVGQAIWFLMGVAVVLIVIISSRQRATDGQ